MKSAPDKETIQLAERVADDKYWLLPAPAKLEKYFTWQNYDKRTLHFRITLYLGVFLLAIYGIAEIINMRDGNYTAAIIRYGIVVPTTLVAIKFFDKPRFAFLQDWLIAFSMVFISALIFVSRYDAYLSGKIFYYYGYLLTVCYVNIVVQPRFIPSLIASSIVCIGSIVFFSLLDLPTNQFTFIVFDSTFFIFLSLLANYYIQLQIRKNFARSILQQQAIENEQKVQNQLKELSTKDALTQCYNRHYFDDLISKMDNQNVGILFIDIDYFKKYNDSYGHLKGDQCLQLVSGCIKTNVRQNDIPIRYGGEEFVILMRDTNTESSIQTGLRIIEQVAALAIPHESSPLGNISISIGCSVSGDDTSLKDCLETADKALYEAKKLGRNQLFTY